MIIDELRKKHKSLDVIKAYTESGQKMVYLVNVKQYGPVILKIVKKMDERIRREIDIVNDLCIPGVPKILEVSSITINKEKHFYYFEEFVEGKTLKEVIQDGPLELSKCLHLIESLLIIATKLESIGIVHRDIKPDNIICRADGSIHLIDFGIARNLNLTSLTMTEMAVGPHTPGYAAPELFQYNKLQINSKADLFSIGIVVYEAIFGKHPFIKGNEMDVNEVWYLTRNFVPADYFIPGDTDGQLIGFIKTLMQKQPSKRPPSAKTALEWYYVVYDTLNLSHKEDK